MKLTEAAEISARRDLLPTEVQELLSAASDSLEAGLNAVALDVARAYVSGSLSFAAGDAILNALFSYATGKLETMPQPMYGIFDAFDQGKYQHKGDEPDVDPQQKYTQPRLAEILKNPP